MALRAVEILHVQDLLSHIYTIISGKEAFVEDLPECPAVRCISRQRPRGLW